MSKTERSTKAQATARTTEGQRRDVKLGYLVHDVSRLRRHAFDQLMKPYGVTRSQWWVLGQLMRQDGMTQTQLATNLDVGRASLGILLDRLEASGLILRVADAVDKRANRVFLTKNAEHLVETMIEQEKAFNQQILKGISASDRDKVIECLSSIKDALLGIVSTT